MTEVVRNFTENYTSNLRIVHLELGKTGVRRMNDDKVFNPNGIVKKETQALVRDVVTARKKLLKLPENHTGVDIESVQNFFAEEGLMTGDFLVLDPAHLDHFNSITREHRMAEYPAAREGFLTHGTSITQINMAVVPRFAEVEEEHGVEAFESTLVHELTHTTSRWNEILMIGSEEKLGIYPQRANFIRSDSTNGGTISDKSNYFFEEGFAALMEAKYATKMGRPTSNYSVPDKARVGLERLVDELPDFYPALIEARASVEGLRKIARLTNSVQPGLYSKLSRLSYANDDFALGTEMIEKALAS